MKKEEEIVQKVIGFRLDVELIKEFKIACIKNNEKYSDVVRDLMMIYTLENK